MEDRVQQRFTELFGPEFGHGKPFDLSLLRSALEALGSPQLTLPPVIHVAGTNGKGSTIAFMSAIAEAAGHKVHAFTKPHLFQPNERLVVSSRFGDDRALLEAAEDVARVAPALTQFDAQVAVALLLFREHQAALAFIETGMGGRDDSTNVIGTPAASVITPIGLDHQDALGETLAEIAAHKAGIIKAGAPVVVARQAPEAMEVIEAHEFFALRPDQIEVVIHPQSIIHAMVGFHDGAVMAHMGAPDMRHAIGYALNWPQRNALPVARLDLAALGSLTFTAPDLARFPALRLCREVMATGGAAGAVFTAAKEVALDEFIAGRIGFMAMAGVVEGAISRLSGEISLSAAPTGLEQVLHIDHLSRIRAAEVAAKVCKGL